MSVIDCPICGSNTFNYISYSEYCWGIVEQHGYCNRCGYIIEQAYSPVHEAFWDIKKGFKDSSGKYHPKNVKKHKRIRRKMNVKNIEINPCWCYFI